jgi:hypothetical protein
MVRQLIEAASMAAAGLEADIRDPIQAVLDVASENLTSARDALRLCRGGQERKMKTEPSADRIDL